MSERSRWLAGMIGASMPLFERFLEGFDDTNRTRQAPGLPNHAAWTLGHLALVTTRCADRVRGHDDPRELPAEDFGGGGAERYAPESVAFGSTPVDDPSAYPRWARCVEAYRSGHERLIDAVGSASEAQLDRAVPWGSGTTTGQRLAERMVFHLGTHAGQIVDLRRALGLGPVIR